MKFQTVCSTPTKQAINKLLLLQWYRRSEILHWSPSNHQHKCMLGSTLTSRSLHGVASARNFYGKCGSSVYSEGTVRVQWGYSVQWRYSECTVSVHNRIVYCNYLRSHYQSVVHLTNSYSWIPSVHLHTLLGNHSGFLLYWLTLF